MNAPQDTLQSEAPVPEFQDKFASGDQNKLNLLALRLAAWLFHPPYFPTELIWGLLALIATNCAVGLLSLPDAYWINPGTSSYYTFLGTPFKWDRGQFAWIPKLHSERCKCIC